MIGKLLFALHMQFLEGRLEGWGNLTATPHAHWELRKELPFPMPQCLERTEIDRTE